MQKLLIYILLLLPVNFFEIPEEDKTETPSTHSQTLYHAMELEELFDYKVFEMAMMGLENVDTENKDILTIIDFTKPSTEERFFVLDIRNREVLHVSHVAHGRNSGWNYATSFSNKSGSHQSSLGFYLTGKTYNGHNGYSLILHGLEKGFNDNAYDRAVVIHGADYCDPEMIPEDGRLGRSFGCPALPRTLNNAIINTIKEGSLLFIYANDENYLKKSAILNSSQLSENQQN